MYGKVWKIFVKAAIAILLVSGLMLVTAGTLKTLGYIGKIDDSSAIRFILGKIQFGSLTDWLSASCNVVMAYAAYKAYLLAKDYFSDFVKKDGYDLIKVLQLDLIKKAEQNLNLSVINVLDVDVQSYVNGGIGMLQNEGEESTLKHTLTQDLESLNNSLRLSRKLEWEINKTLNDLEVYGWSMIPLKKEQLIYALKCNHHLFSLVHSVTIYLSEILSRDEDNFLPIYAEPFINYDSGNPNSPLQSQDIDLLVSKLTRYVNMIYDIEKSTPYGQTIDAFAMYFRSGKHLKNYFQYLRK